MKFEILELSITTRNQPFSKRIESKLTKPCKQIVAEFGKRTSEYSRLKQDTLQTEVNIEQWTNLYSIEQNYLIYDVF